MLCCGPAKHFICFSAHPFDVKNHPPAHTHIAAMQPLFLLVELHLHAT